MIKILFIFLITCDSSFKQIDIKSNEINDKAINREVVAAVNLANIIQNQGKLHKAAKIFKYVLSLDLDNVEALSFYTKYTKLQEEEFKNKIHFYPIQKEQLSNKPFADPVVLDKIDFLIEKFNNKVSLLNKEYLVPTQYDSCSYLSSCFKRLELKTFDLGNTWFYFIKNYFSKDKIRHRKRTFSLNDLLEIHRHVTQSNNTNKPGMLRVHQVAIGHYAPPPAYLVKSLMDEYIDWLNEIMSSYSKIHPIEIASLAHIKFVNIHPFYDGNGRTGRILMNLVFMKFNYPPLIIMQEEKKQYNEYMSQSNKGINEPFINFIANLMLMALQEVIECING